MYIRYVKWIIVYSFHVSSKEELLELLKDVDTDDIFIIGGESIYREFLPLCDTAMITKIDYAYEADAYFPNLDQDEEWECVEEGEEQTCFDMEFYFTVYKRKVTAEVWDINKTPK